MATNSTHINATPEDVFAVLADGWTYSNWVVGTSHMRAVETEWPAPGSRLFHATGVWPAVARDETQVEDVEDGRRIVLIARGRPIGQARVSIELHPEGDGCRVTMRRHRSPGPAAGYTTGPPKRCSVAATPNP